MFFAQQLINKIFFCLSPLLVYKITGSSMVPTYTTGDIVIGLKFFFKLKPENIIILHSPSDNRLIIKRIKNVQGSKYFVVGDNEQESTDSRDFGWIEGKSVVAKIVCKL